MASRAGEDDRLGSDGKVTYANYSKRRDPADHVTPGTSGISTDSGDGSRNKYTTFISGLDIRLSVAFQAQAQVLFDFLIDARGISTVSVFLANCSPCSIAYFLAPLGQAGGAVDEEKEREFRKTSG
jgi:hypothetical protein